MNITIPKSADHGRRKIIGAVLALVATVLVVGTAISSESFACRSCHAMRPLASAQDESAHASIDCYDCHLDDGGWSFMQAKADEFFRMYPVALLGGATDGLTGPGRWVNSSRCLECHRQVLTEVTDRGGLKIRHDTCSPASRDCGSCHSATAHGDAVRWIREPQMETCIVCHDESGASVACDLCHAGKTTEERLSKGPWAITHGPRWRTTHGMGNLLTCTVCHPGDYCTRCHGLALPHPRGFYIDHGTEAQREDTQCSSCHSKDDFCAPCHGMDMPHPPSFREAHPDSAVSMSDPACVSCHFESDCLACHTKHTHPGRTDGYLDLSGLGGGS